MSDVQRVAWETQVIVRAGSRAEPWVDRVKHWADCHPERCTVGFHSTAAGGGHAQQHLCLRPIGVEWFADESAGDLRSRERTAETLAMEIRAEMPGAPLALLAVRLGYIPPAEEALSDRYGKKRRRGGWE